MRIAILSDIHSNKYALTAVLQEINNLNISKIIILGDIFGYYPWAVETYKMLPKIDFFSLKGNHDVFVTQRNKPDNVLSYWEAAKDNEEKLASECPEALPWLESLKCNGEIIIDGIKLSLFHGTPDDACNGRFYPDDNGEYRWFPGRNEIILLGHTHYPMEIHTPTGGLIINPGSVGQPRDGNPYPSWCVLEMDELFISWQRTQYNYMEAVRELERVHWEKRSIRALQKDYKGPLKIS